MRYLALATDYDGTLAHHGRVDATTLASIERLAASGRKLILVTGRELPDLKRVFPELDRFDRVVAENGALLYTPATRKERVLADAPPAAFVSELELRGVKPLSVGASIVATWHPMENVVLQVIRDLGLELQVIFNKGAVMVLPAGVNKSTGLAAALEELGLSPHNVVAVGDAENDHALLQSVQASVAVANAVPALKAAADIVTRADHGAGVAELIDSLLESDLTDLQPQDARRTLLLGVRADSTEVRIPALGHTLLVAGTSGSGKSTLTTSLLEQLRARRYQCCVIDPEGDYDELADVIGFGTAERAPDVAEILTGLERPGESVVVNLLGVKLQDRPAFFASLLLRLQEQRARTGRPHWILVDEAHHLLPTNWEPAPQTLTQALTSMVYVTVHPDALAPAVREGIDVVAVLGDAPRDVFKAVGIAVPSGLPALESGQAMLSLYRGEPVIVAVPPSHSERRRHQRKYAKGELGPDRSFYFRGPQNKLNLRAQNLITFLQLAEGVDEETWFHHLGSGHYSQWLANCIKDEDLARDVQAVERQAAQLDAATSRARIRAAIEQRYTLPEDASPL
ncbi:MAG TPA: HAD-IIB family hydrolase [Steroidobacteraceae bacterium]|nr:HAD-IIB family hydrolase [Steroidobacteraceae bacterium]